MNDDSRISVGYGAVAVALAAVLVYAIALQNGFALDDVVLIPGDARVTTPHIGALLTRTYWNDSTLALYRPLTSVSFALDWYVSKGAAAWFHFVNIVWHLLASISAYFLLTRFFRPRAAMVGGLIFALHPVHVEAVANVVGRAEMMGATFFFLACLAWTADELGIWSRIVLTAGCYVVAMLCKESTIALPGILILLDAARNKWHKEYIREHALAFATLALALVLTLALRLSVVGELGPSRLDPALEITRTAGSRIITALQAWPVEARLLFFPRTLLADYDPQTLMPLSEWTPLAVIGLTLLLASVIGGVVALLKKSWLWALGLLWFPVTILVVSNLIIPIGVLVAERTLYLPSFAVAFAASALVSRIRIPALAIALAALLLAVRTVTRIPVWKSTDAVELSVANAQPNSFRAQWHLARMARSRGDADNAIRRYDRAIKLWPYREGLVEEAAAYGGEKGRSAWARDIAFWGTLRWPNEASFHRMLAGNAIDLGDTATARKAVSSGLRISPNDTILNQMWRAFGPRAQ